MCISHTVWVSINMLLLLSFDSCDISPISLKVTVTGGYESIVPHLNAEGKNHVQNFTTTISTNNDKIAEPFQFANFVVPP